MEKNKTKIVFFTGAGISKESGIETFRDCKDGLWENFDIEEVATAKAWMVNRSKVLDFYNTRRKALDSVFPNSAHEYIASLQKDFEVVVVTQNVDDLHERAGSRNVIHIHGELRKMCSSKNRNLTYPCLEDIKEGDKAEDGSQLRPDIVWFGEDVPKLAQGVKEVLTADLFVIIGTSMQVYPAAGIINFVKDGVPIIYIDPNEYENMPLYVDHIAEGATEGVKKLDDILKKYLELGI